jgi:hypothetical protein
MRKPAWMFLLLMCVAAPWVRLMKRQSLLVVSPEDALNWYLDIFSHDSTATSDRNINATSTSSGIAPVSRKDTDLTDELSSDYNYHNNPEYQDYVQRTRSILRLYRAQALMKQQQKRVSNQDTQNETNATLTFGQAFFEHHPALTPLDQRYRPPPEWSTTAVANINIAGNPKAGTTQLYQLLMQHRDALPFHPSVKEHCVLDTANTMRLYAIHWTRQTLADMYKNNSSSSNAMALKVQDMLYQHHAQNHERWAHRVVHAQNTTDTSHQRAKLTVNGCIRTPDVQLSWYYLRPNMQTTKYLFILRDPADLLFSYFTFFSMHRWDTNMQGNNRMRTPELFHEFLLTGQHARPGELLLTWLYKPLHAARQLIRFAGRPHVLFLRNEDMVPERVTLPGGLLDQLIAFTGLSRDGFDATYLHRYANCGGSSGDLFGVCNGTRPVGTRITRGQTMLPESRTLIYLLMQQECVEWERELGLSYPDCIHILEARQSLE